MYANLVIHIHWLSGAQTVLPAFEGFAEWFRKDAALLAKSAILRPSSTVPMEAI